MTDCNPSAALSAAVASLTTKARWPIAKLAEPDQLSKAALTGDPVDVLVRIPVAHLGSAYREMLPIMDDGTPDLMEWFVAQGRSDVELRLLCALFQTLKEQMPMGVAQRLKLLELEGPDQYLDDFAVKRIAIIDERQKS